jgi:hypothetical protein
MSSQAFDHRFAALLAQYEALGLIGLGKLADPTTGQPHADLGRARAAIEMLQMVEAKTRGNLAEPEERELRRVLTTLRLNYVEEARRDAAGGPTPEPSGGSGDEAGETGREAPAS